MNAHDIETLIAESLNLHAAAADADRCADVPDGIELVYITTPGYASPV